MTPAEITLPVTLAVLGAGFLHALWNAMLKSAAGEPLLDTALIVAGSAVVALALLPFVAVPARAAWPFMALSAVIHFAYYITLAGAYRRGDLSFAYPLMRGVAPLIVTVLGVVFLGEHPSASMLAGIALISLGILVIAWYAGGRHTAAAAGWALANALIIALYTLVDGAGTRASGSAAGYVCWLIFLEGLPYLAWIYATRGPSALDYLRPRWRRGIAGGAASLAAYGIALWAMTRAPVAVVAALREVSVLFAAAIGALVLKEGFGWRRMAGAAAVVAGVAALRL
ncbi:MAG TPA: EamA family transporter [Casimicrobiaceae bacterium]|jgi:drug/metabolite transporter (DMT)-like permease|nr:EamA family transporter [Casimicrobiaceae bacterium]